MHLSVNVLSNNNSACAHGIHMSILWILIVSCTPGEAVITTTVVHLLSCKKVAGFSDRLVLVNSFGTLGDSSCAEWDARGLLQHIKLYLSNSATS